MVFFLAFAGESGPQFNTTPYNPYLTQPQAQPTPIQQQIRNKQPFQPLATTVAPTTVSSHPVNSPTNIVITTQVLNPDLCPACRMGRLEYDYTCLGICCAIFFFPVGILCCLALRDGRCVDCNAQF